MDVKELLSMLEFGADRIFKGDGGRMPTDKEFEELMDRSDAGQSKVAEMTLCITGLLV